MNTDKRFLNYKEYENFKQDLANGKISEDSIVFIQDKHCIWARGEEYGGDTAKVCSEAEYIELQNNNAIRNNMCYLIYK